MLACQAEASDDACVLWNADEVLSILRKRACVKAVFSGHCHGAPVNATIHQCSAPCLIMRARNLSQRLPTVNFARILTLKMS